MNETVVSFCGCDFSVKLNILYLWKLVDEIINNSRANAIFISTGFSKKYQIFNKNVIIYLYI